MNMKPYLSRLVTRPQHVASALLALARADHYMIGLIEDITLEELNDAEQILITRQNRCRTTNSIYYRTLDRALDLLDIRRKKLLAKAAA
jgi:hypothetical protein